MASPLHTAQPSQNNGSPSWLARIIAAIIHDLQYIWSYFSTAYSGSFTDANGNVIEITDGGVVESVNPDLQFTTNETFVSFVMTSTTDPVTIEWGDTTQETVAGGAVAVYSHTYADAGTYVVRINGTTISLFAYDNTVYPSPASLISVDIIPDTLEYMTLTGNSLLNYINFAQFVNLAEFMITDCPLIANITSVPTPPAGFTFQMVDCDGIVNVDTTTFADCNAFMLTNSPLVETLDLTQLTNVGGSGNLIINGLTGLKKAELAAGSMYAIVQMEGCTSLTSLAIPAMPNMDTFSADGCTKLKTLTLGNISVCTTFLCGQGTRLSTSNINTILTTIDAYGTNGGTIDISGQNPPRVPTGAGATAKANLIGRGWTIVTDI